MKKLHGVEFSNSGIVMVLRNCLGFGTFRIWDFRIRHAQPISGVEGHKGCPAAQTRGLSSAAGGEVGEARLCPRVAGLTDGERGSSHAGGQAEPWASRSDQGTGRLPPPFAN